MLMSTRFLLNLSYLFARGNSLVECPICESISLRLLKIIWDVFGTFSNLSLMELQNIRVGIRWSLEGLIFEYVGNKVVVYILLERVLFKSFLVSLKAFPVISMELSNLSIIYIGCPKCKARSSLYCATV